MRKHSTLSLLAAFAAACSAAPEPVRPPLALAIAYDDRSCVLAAGKGTDLGAATRLAVSVRDCPAIATGTPADTLVEAILANRGRPFRAGSKLLRGLSVTSPENIAAAGRSATAAGLVSSEFVTRITTVGSGLPDVLVMREGTELRLGLRTREGVSATDGAAFDWQLALLRPLPPDQDGVLALLQRQPGSDHAVALVLRLGAAASAAELAEVRAQLAAAATAPEPDRANPASRPTDLAREAVGARPRRHALLAVAAKHELPRCLDLLLCIEERELIAIAEQLPGEPASAWDIERAFCAAVLPALQRGELAPEVGVCLRRHFGALALDPTALEFALQTSPTAEQFDSTLLDGNLRALDARHARRRVAAAAWLAATDHAIADYDPLAPRQQRKAAIRRYRQAHDQ